MRPDRGNPVTPKLNVEWSKRHQVNGRNKSERRHRRGGLQLPNFVFGGKGWDACRSANALILFSIYCLGFLFCVVSSYRCAGLGRVISRWSMYLHERCIPGNSSFDGCAARAWASGRSARSLGALGLAIWGGDFSTNRRNAYGRRWKTLEDVAGRCGEASRNRLEDVILILKRRKAFFFF